MSWEMALGSILVAIKLSLMEEILQRASLVEVLTTTLMAEDRKSPYL